MTPKENLLAAFRHDEPEWIPWVPLIGSAVNIPSFVPEPFKKDDNDLRISHFLQDELGCDILIGVDVLRQRYQTAKVTTEKKDDHTYTTINIAGRTLTSTSRTLPFVDLETSYISEHLVKEPVDIETMKFLVEDTYYELDDEPYQMLADGLGDRGVVHTIGRSDPLLKCVIGLMGLECFIYSLSDYPKELHALLEKIDTDNIESYKILVQSDAEVMASFDDICTHLVSPDLYEQYGLPSLRKYTDICHDSGKLFMKHSCGHVRDMLPMLLNAGYDAHHYLASPPIGNTPLCEARDVWKNNITIIAAMDPLMLVQGSPDDVRENVISILKDAAPGRSFMLVSSSKPDVPEDNIRMIGETMKEFGKYPLACE